MITKKPKLLIPITVQFSVRYIVRTGLIEKILPYVTPIVVLGWEDQELTHELESLGVKVHLNPHKKTSLKYDRMRSRINNLHNNNLGTCTTKIDQRRARLMRSWKRNIRITLRNQLYSFEGYLPGSKQRWKNSEQVLLENETNYNDHRELIKRINPDFVFCTSPYYFEEELLLRAAQSFGIPISTAILSFDNLTTRGYMPIIFEEYYLWNHYNKNELYRIYPEALRKKVKIVGAPQFDFYYQSSYIWDEHYWRKQLGIEEGRPVILYGAGPINITPYEQLWVEQIDNAITSGEIVGKPIILFRRHPVDPPERWNELMGITKNTIYDSSWHGKENIGKTNITRYDMEKLASTLKHSVVHVNTSSTMTIDGAIFDRPQIGPAYDDSNGKNISQAMYELYFREHFLPITESGGLELARSRDELIHQINMALENPSKLINERKEMVTKICTYTDGKATNRVAESLLEFIKSTNYKM